MLSDLKRYLKAHRRATLSDLANRFDADPDAMRGMVEHWERKGQVKAQRIDPACGPTCGTCGTSSACSVRPGEFELYEWVDR
jgi:putative ferrous iron transport protein C